MRDPEKQKELTQEDIDKMTLEEKFQRTSLESYRERWTLIREYKYCYETKQERHYWWRWHDQRILWAKDIWTANCAEKCKEMHDVIIRRRIQGYTDVENDNDDKSIPGRLHFHIYK